MLAKAGENSTGIETGPQAFRIELQEFPSPFERLRWGSKLRIAPRTREADRMNPMLEVRHWRPDEDAATDEDPTRLNLVTRRAHSRISVVKSSPNA